VLRRRDGEAARLAPAVAVLPSRRGSRAAYLAPAAVAVLLGSADTYVVVLALPDLLTGIGLGLENLARAAPIVSGFLLGYVVVLPLAGRISDVAGRTPVLAGCLLTFALGSLVTASAGSLPVVVAGRGLQGLGAGGLVPPTLALVADLWPERDRGLPLGVVGAAQELGAVLGPLAGAAVLAVADWRAIFWVNLAAALVLAALLGRSGGRAVRPARLLPLGVAVLGAAVLAVALRPPAALAEDVTLGTLVVPVAGDAAALSPLGIAALLLLAVAVGVVAVRLRAAAAPADVDVAGALLLAVALGGVVLTFAGADTTRTVTDDRWPLYLGVAAVAAGTFAVRQRSARTPLVPPGTLAAAGARAAVAVNLLVGVALVAVVVDVPVFARVTRFPTSQLGGALVLLEFLAALPVGALLGGWAVRSHPPRLLAACGLLAGAVALAATLTWDALALYGAPAQLLLVVAGLGFGLAIAPVNAVLLASTPAGVHGLASALAVLARTVGMLVGLSVLTAVGLHVFEERQAGIPSPFTLCPSSPTACPAYGRATLASVVGELQAVFAGAAIALAVAVLVAAVWLRPRHVPSQAALQEASA
jgi:MFS family permease